MVVVVVGPVKFAIHLLGILFVFKNLQIPPPHKSFPSTMRLLRRGERVGSIYYAW